MPVSMPASVSVKADNFCLNQLMIAMNNAAVHLQCPPCMQVQNSISLLEDCPCIMY